MDTATLQALGITPADLIDRIVSKATEELLTNEAYAAAAAAASDYEELKRLFAS